MLVETLIVSLLFGTLFKRSLSWLQGIEFEWAVVVIVAFSIESLLNLVGHIAKPELLQWTYQNTLYFQIGIYYLLIVFVLRNWRVKGMMIMGVGILLNALVIFANNGFMPVDITMGQIYHFEHTLYELNHHLIFGHAVLSDAHSWTNLADIIDIPPPYMWPKTISVGDIFIDIGVLLMVLSACFSEVNSADLKTQESSSKNREKIQKFDLFRRN